MQIKICRYNIPDFCIFRFMYYLYIRYVKIGIIRFRTIIQLSDIVHK